MRRIYNSLLSMSIVLAGIGLIIACVGIYQSGEAFSRESVAIAFAGVDVPVYICLFLIVGSIILEFFVPSEKEKLPKIKNYQAILFHLCNTRNFKQCDEKFQKQTSELRRQNCKYGRIRKIVILITSVLFLIYACNSNHFHQSDINTSMIHAMLVLVPCFAIAFGVSLFVSVAHEKNLIKEIELTKKIPALTVERNKQMPNEKKEMLDKLIDENKNKRLAVSQSIFITIAVVFIIYGFVTGGTIDVLAKAINICTECIGLG